MTAPSLTVTLLGTGTSTGIPLLGCRCRVCTSPDPRDQRLRTAAHVVAHTDAGPVHLQLDAGPDFRTQALAAGLTTADAVLVTHEHFDHVTGLDDLRPFFFRNPAPMPVCTSRRVAAALEEMFAYIFRDGTYPGVSRLVLREVARDDDAAPPPFTVPSREATGAEVEVVPLPALHGRLPVLGFRIGRFAYLTDVSAIPDATRARLDGLDTLVLDGLRPEPHPTHFSFDEAVAVARAIGARDTVLTHLSHHVRHAETTFPEGVRLGYDGLVLRVPGG